ncbi:MAG TPA: WD40 repeat domain-containing protein, partial [Polyangiaceae bacterium]|nr:WD40 repeat domain-containing protein [Polyangiaceae bacterium]
VERLRALPVLPVVGPSGAGKSSFVQAGVIPRLREQARWRVIQLRPSSRPFELLAARLSRRRSTRSVRLSDNKFSSRPPPSRHADPISVSEVSELASQLMESPALLGIELRALALDEQSHVLLFIDALEELFALVPSDDTRARFIEAICSAADDPEEPVRVVFTVRDDFLGRLAVSADAREALAQVTLIQRLSPSALIETLERPVRAVGYGYQDPDLPRRMVAAVRNEPAGLPLLQFAGQRLWDERDVEQRLLSSAVYERMGGVEGALAKHADGVLAAMSAAELRIARAILLLLVSAEGTRRALARAEVMTELAQAEVITSENESAAEAVLGRLTQARLVTVTRSPGDEGRGAPSLELAHESLIRRWHMLARWLDESKEERTFLAEITQAAELWDRRGRREEELWQASALGEALRFAERTGQRLPEPAQAFIVAGQHRLRRGQRRKRILLASAMLGLALIAVVLAFQKHEADVQRNEAEERQLEAEAQRAEALRESAASAYAQGHLLEARAKLRMALERQDTTAARALWWQLESSPLEWDVDLGSVVYGVAISRDGRTIAAACQDKGVYLFDGRSAAQRVLRGHRDQVSAVALSPDGKRLASGSLTGELFLWDAATGKLSKRIAGHEGRINGLSFSADGSLLASASADGTLRISRDGSLVRTLRSDEARHSVALSPDGKIIAAAGKNRTIALFNVASGDAIATLSGHDDVVEEVTFSPDGKLLASASRDRTVRIWRSTGEHLRTLSGHRDRVRSVSFSGDGKKLASASHDRSIIVWDVGSGERAGLLEAHTDLVFGVRFASDAPLLVSGGVDKSIKLWRVEATNLPESEGHEGGVYSVSFHDGAIVTGGDDRAVRVWDIESGEQRAVLRGHTAVVFGAAFSPDGGLIASGSADTTVRLWQTASLSEARALSGHGAGVNAVAFSPDGRTLASTSADTTVRLWEVSSGREQHVLRGHEAHVMRASFSPDGRLLATSGYDGTVRIWDVATGTVKHVARGHGDRVYGVSFSPDGKTVASGGFDQTVRLIDAASGKELASTK